MTTVTLSTTGAITLQTYGFGGGVNAAGTTIAAGGFDPFVGHVLRERATAQSLWMGHRTS